ncbi:hypothetical protein ACFYPX_18025 [Micromonospora zamorensis]|uniref:hypothetical protein n=1 Tax=Micromonospora zamorensis TaxID=709883 RepID=UPI003675764B
MTTEAEQIKTQLRVLTREVQRLTDRLDGVVTLSNDAKDTADAALRAAGQLAEELVDAVRADPPAAEHQDDDSEVEKVVPALSWLTITDADDAAQLMKGLPEWLATVYCRWVSAPLADCWAWHPAVVTELLALRDAWNAALDPASFSAAKQMDWVDRYRPGAARRIKQELKECALSAHTPDQRTAYRPPRVEGAEMLPELTDWWVRTGGQSTAPAPTASMLATSRARMVEDE